MKIGILTYHCAHNYGAILQCYALQEYLKGCGYDTEVIDYRPSFLVNPYKVFQRYRFSFRKPFRLPYELYRELRYAIPRWISFNRSIHRLIDMHHRSSTEVDPSYDVYIIGSDQIWNLEISHGDLNYFADFPFEKGRKKYIAYAASMELTELTPEKKQICERCLPFFDAIGVREKNLLDILKPYAPDAFCQVVDPVFLISREKWDTIAVKPKIMDNYAVLYQVRENEVSREFARKAAAQRGLRLVEVTAWVKRAKITGDDIQTASPEEFIGWIKCADLVITSSFHGTAFSIIYDKDFIALNLNDGADSRIGLILERYGLTDRFKNVGDEPTETKKNLSVGENLSNDIEESFSFISSSLTNN